MVKPLPPPGGTEHGSLPFVQEESCAVHTAQSTPQKGKYNQNGRLLQLHYFYSLLQKLPIMKNFLLGLAAWGTGYGPQPNGIILC